MPDPIRLLTLPMEIRCHIYSFIYLENRIVGFLQPKSHYTKTALFLSCQQLHQETLEYYYGRNTFSLPLWQRFAVSDWRFLPRHFDLVKVLHLEANAFFWRSSSDSGKIFERTKNCQRRLEKYLKAIFWANQGVVAPNLKTLIFVDSVPTHSYDRGYWDRVIETSKETVDGYVQVFEKLHIGVGEVVVKLQKEYSWEKTTKAKCSIDHWTKAFGRQQLEDKASSLSNCLSVQCPPLGPAALVASDDLALNGLGIGTKDFPRTRQRVSSMDSNTLKNVRQFLRQTRNEEITYRSRIKGVFRCLHHDIAYGYCNWTCISSSSS